MKDAMIRIRPFVSARAMAPAIAVLLVLVASVLGADSQLGVKRVERAAEDAPQAQKQTGGKTFAEIKKQYNLADDVSEDYPVVFNMILFISVSLILALIAICVTIATMDPGRDSLIYRVTSSQRYKKDN